MKELSQEKQELELRLDGLDRLSVSQGEIQTIVPEAMQCLVGLEPALRNGVAEQKQTALRQCIGPVHVDKPAGKANILRRVVLASNLPAQAECDVVIP